MACLTALAACGGGGSSGTSNPSATYDPAAAGIPKFVTTNYVDVAATANGQPLIDRISMFRSSVGHDYNDGTERCRSMKHYVMTPDANTDLVSPVTGSILNVLTESRGLQLGIVSDAQPAFEFRIFHINPVRTFRVGDRVTAGQKLGTHFSNDTYSDIAVFVNTPNGIRAISYFETLTAEAFQPFKDRGIAAPADLILTKAQRDAAPLTCTGEQFLNPMADSLPQWIVLGPIKSSTGAPATAESR